LRFDQKLNFRYLTGYQLYSFVDAGAAWNDGFRCCNGPRPEPLATDGGCPPYDD